MNYVMHFCRNKECNNGWVDKDLTGATTFPPKWKYCKECAKKLGIDFTKQTPNSNLTKKELAEKTKRIEKLKKAREEHNKKLNPSI